MKTALFAVLLAALLLLGGCDTSVQLFSAMSERDANEVVASLGGSGIEAHKLPGKEGVGIEVPQASVARAISILEEEGLPREHRSSMGEVFRKEGLISSPLEERARYLWALSQELSETVSEIDGVIRARVHVVLPERSTGGDPPMPSSAAVFVKYRRGVVLDESVPQIRRLVASSIPGLQADKVTVVLVPSGRHLPFGGRPPVQNETPAWLPAAVAALIVLTLAAAGFGGWRMTRAKSQPADGAVVDPDAPQAEPA
jgi:type III secretion protein J